MMDKPHERDAKQGPLTPLSELLEGPCFNNVKDLKGTVLPLNEITEREGFNSLSENVDMLTPIKNISILEPLPTTHSSEDKEDTAKKEDK